jgi:phosphate/phosphite/phosphonate ABC transporter binding protein
MTEQQIGRYRVLQLLGRGGMGDVYLASAQGAAGFEKPVAIKILRPQAALARDLLREAFIGVHLDHGNVVQILDLDQDGDRYFLAMEYVRGYTLAHILEFARTRGQPIPLRATLHIVRQLVDALEYVHGLGGGIIHRDVSPSNVLIGTDGRVKLSDFGVAALGAEGGADVLVGKPAYLPPEAFRGARPEQSWDVYALGVTLWEALAGERPYTGDTLGKMRAAILKGPRRLEANRIGAGMEGSSRFIDPQVVAVAERAIDPAPDRRYRTAADLRAALAEAYPPTVDDVGRHRQYVRSCFSAPDFITRNGALPTMSGTAELTPRPNVAEASAPTVAARAAIRVGLSQAGGSGWARGEGERLATRLSSVLGRPVVSIVVADYRSLIDCLSTGILDLAWMPPAAFVEAKKQGARALAVASRLGRTVYHSAIIARKDSPISSLADLEGASIAWVDHDSASGYLFALAEIIRAHGSTAKLGQEHFVGSHRSVCEAVANGWAACGATYVILDDQGEIKTSGWHERLGERADELKVVAYTRPIPGDNVACRAGFDEAEATDLAKALVDLAHDDEGRAILHGVFRAEALVPVPDDIYGDVRETLLIVSNAKM